MLVSEEREMVIRAREKDVLVSADRVDAIVCGVGNEEAMN